MARSNLARHTYPTAIVARAKAGLACGLTIKAVAHIMDVDPVTVAEWKQGKRRAEVPPDHYTMQMIKGVLVYGETIG